MDPTTFALLMNAMSLATQVLVAYPQLREIATTEQKERLDVLYAEARAASNAVADRLAATPDDPT